MKSGSMPLSTSNDDAHAYISVQHEIVSLCFSKIWQIKLFSHSWTRHMIAYNQQKK